MSSSFTLTLTVIEGDLQALHQSLADHYKQYVAFTVKWRDQDPDCNIFYLVAAMPPTGTPQLTCTSLPRVISFNKLFLAAAQQANSTAANQAVVLD